MKDLREQLVCLVLLVFTAFGVARHRSVTGDDLAASFVGCRILAAGQSAHLYSHDPELFSRVDDDVWDQTADDGRFAPLNLLHPYVQTPLWAYALRPLCTRVDFPMFRTIFLILIMLSMSGILWLVTHFWAPGLFHPGWVALICACLYASEPFRYAIYLVQTHILILFLTVLAVVLARRERPIWAGVLLALAAAVKITPAFLLVYWLMNRHMRASVSFIVSSVGLVLLTILATGPQLTLAYVHELSEVSKVLLVAFNNQSLAAWWMGHFYSPDDLFSWQMHPLPPLIKVVSLLLGTASAVIGGWLDRQALTKHPAPPYGAVFALLGATMFTPIAWTHYYVLLVIPFILLIDMQGARLKPAWVAFLVAALGLNYSPVTFNSVHMTMKSFSVVRSHFFSGLLCLGALFVVAVRNNRSLLQPVRSFREVSAPLERIFPCLRRVSRSIARRSGLSGWTPVNDFYALESQTKRAANRAARV